MVHKTKYIDFGKNKGYASFDGEIGRFEIVMKDGRTVSFFVNRENNLIVGDVMDKDFKGGNEFIRRELDTIPPSSKFKLESLVKK